LPQAEVGVDREAERFEASALQVAAQFGLHGGERNAKRVRERGRRWLALVKKDGHLAEARLEGRPVSHHQKVRQQPGFGVEDPLPLTLVVLRGFPRHRQQLRQGHQRFASEQPQVPLDGLADAGVMIVPYLERGVDLGHPLVEPHRPELLVAA
jgi:hypothetical protein